MGVAVLLRLAIAASAAGLSVPVCAQSPTTATALATRLVDLTLPTEVIQRDARAAYVTNFRTSFLRDPRSEAVVQRMPGLLDAVVSAGAAKFDEIVSAMWPQMKARLSASCAAAMSPEELEVAIRFYSGPVGAKLVAATPTLATGDDVRQVLNPDELVSFVAFRRAPAGQKLDGLRAQHIRDVMETINGAISKGQPRIEEAAMTAGRAYIAANQH